MKWDKYLRLICAQSGIVFDALDLNQFEKCETKLEVNKLLFSNIKNLGVEIPPGLTEGMRSFVESVTAGGSIDQRVKEAKANVVRLTANEERALAEFEERRRNLLEAISEYYKAIMFDPREALARSLELIQKMPEWTYRTANASGGYLEWVTTNDVVCCYKNQLAGVDLQVNLGKFYVRYYPKDGLIRALGASGNTQVDGYIHPHIGSSSSPCWGTAKEAYREAMQLFEPHRVFQALWFILCNYNDESPYISLSRFKKAQEEAHTSPERILVNAGTYWVTEDWFERNTDDYDIEALGEREGSGFTEYLVYLCAYAYRNDYGEYSIDDRTRYYFATNEEGVTELVDIDRDAGELVEAEEYLWSIQKNLEEARKLELVESE